MVESKHAVKGPLEILADLLVTAQTERLYIEQQDIYPLESQRAATILPAIEEDIERRMAELSKTERAIVEDMARLQSKLASEGLPESVRPAEAPRPINREELLTELGRLADNHTINEGEE